MSETPQPGSAEALAIWNQACETDARYTKSFSRGGGFKGTAINSTYLIRKATELWGPMGHRWGVTVLKEEMLEGAPLIDGNGMPLCKELIHKLHISLWYPVADGQGKVEHFGQTQFVGKNKNGFFTDEEAPKKSMTDAISKALSMLGFSADIYLGMYDDSRYLNDRMAEAEKAGPVRASVEPTLTIEQIQAAKDKLSNCETVEALRVAYTELGAAEQKATKALVAALSKNLTARA